MTGEHRDALKQEYAERVETGDAEVERVKSLVREQQAEMADELESLRREESALEVRQKVGEYTPAQFKNATADLRKRMDSLSRLDASYTALLEAETESDVKRASRQAAGAAAPVARTAERVTSESGKAAAAAADGRPQNGFASASSVTPRWLLLGSLGLVIVGGLAAAILFFTATIGGGSGLPSLPSLPSLSGLLPGGDETPTTPTTPPTPPVMPTREPTTPPTTTPAASTPAAILAVDVWTNKGGTGTGASGGSFGVNDQVILYFRASQNCIVSTTIGRSGEQPEMMSDGEAAGGVTYEMPSQAGAVPVGTWLVNVDACTSTDCTSDSVTFIVGSGG